MYLVIKINQNPVLMAWIYLLIAGMFEICWAVGLEHMSGFNDNILSLVFVIISTALSMFFLGMSIKYIPMSVAYAVWSGIGILGVLFYGIIFLHEPISILKTIFISLIAFGIVGLKLVTD